MKVHFVMVPLEVEDYLLPQFPFDEVELGRRVASELDAEAVFGWQRWFYA